MYSRFKQSIRYFDYLFSASNSKGHGIHSPFVFNFVRNVLNDKQKYPEYERVEALRKKLLSDNSPVPVEDYGTGAVHRVGSRSVANIAARSAKSPKYGQLLFRIARHYRCQYILELGTSLGLSAAYLASANKNSMLVTGEGNFVLASMAKKNLNGLDLPNVNVVTGNFDNTLPHMIGSLPHIDLAFIDGNHRAWPTIRYFNALIGTISASAILVIDDIHWSKDMEKAWEYIMDHRSVMLTVDLFFLGIVFFNPNFKVKQHFRIRF